MSEADPPFRVPKTAELVADTIRKRIVQGDLGEGDTLPPEGQLVEQFGVSRPTLREAFRILETERLITVTRGSRTGARVSLPRVENVARYASYWMQAADVAVSDIYEARLALEPYVVRKLASQKSSAATERLREEAGRLSLLYESDRERDYLIASAEFHRVLMEVGGNETLHFLTRVLQDVIEQYQARYIPSHSEEAERKAGMRRGVKSIVKLIDLIEAGDGDAAEAHWRLHLTNTNKVWGIERSLREVLAG